MCIYTDFKGDAYMIHRIQDTYSHSYWSPRELATIRFK